MPPTTSHPASPLPRPKSSSSIHQPHRQSHPHPHPYMVALSGWPEPIYIALPLSSSSSSRAATPFHDLERNQNREGISLITMQRSKSHTKVPYPHTSHTPSRHSTYTPQSTNLPTEPTHPHKPTSIPSESLLSRECPYSAFGMDCIISGHPKHFDGGEHSQTRDDDDIGDRESGYGDDDDGLSPFPTSSTRGTPHPTPPSSPRLSPLLPKRGSSRKSSMSMLPPPTPNKGSSSTIITTTITGSSSSTRSRSDRFADPRLSVLSNRPLPVTPSWSVSSTALPSTSAAAGTLPSQVGQEGRGLADGQEVYERRGVGDGLRGMRSVPEVWPRPGSDEGHVEKLLHGGTSSAVIARQIEARPDLRDMERGSGRAGEVLGYQAVSGMEVDDT